MNDKQPKRLSTEETAWLRQCQLDFRDGVISFAEYHHRLYSIWGV